jgi:MoaA/NifB/PqqE/SkfB family radical SAM enzyme
LLKEESVDYDPETGICHTPPRQVFLELTARCNLACVHCSRDYGLPGSDQLPELTLEQLEALAPWLEAAQFVNLNIVGEPLLYPHFDEAVRLAGRGGAEVAFNTNGLLLDERRSRFLVEYGLRSVVISFDGRELNQRVRGVGWEKLRDRLITLDRVKREMGADEPLIGLAYTLMKSNLRELPQLLEEVLPHADVHAVHVQPLLVFWETLRDENIYEAQAVDEVVAEARAICAAHDTELTLFRSSFSQDERDLSEAVRQLGPASERFGCIDPCFEVKILADGKVMSCSYGRQGGARVGDVPLDEIWNSPWYRALRRDLYAKRYTDACVHCPYVHGCTRSQLDSLQSGLHHSREARFREEGAGTAPPAGG